MSAAVVRAQRGPNHQSERVTALCNECGEQRDVSARYARNGYVTRRLKCRHCGRETTHYSGEAGRGDDWREAKNRESGTADLLARIRHTEDMFLRLGVDLRDVEPASPDDARAILWRGVGAGVDKWVLHLNDDLTLAARLNVLCYAWQAMVSIDCGGKRCEWHDLAKYSPPDEDGTRWFSYRWPAHCGTTVTEALAASAR